MKKKNTKKAYGDFQLKQLKHWKSTSTKTKLDFVESMLDFMKFKKH